MPDSRREAGIIVAHLSRALLDGSRDLSTVPSLIERVIDEQMWRVRVDPASGREFTCRSFDEFVKKGAAYGGLGSTAAQLYQLCPDLTDKLDKAFGRKQRTDKIIGNFDNIQESDDLKAPTGTAKRTALRRLRKDAPELHAEVLAGRLTAHGAMVRAGYRQKTVTVPVARPDAVARSLLKYMSADDIAKLIAVLLGKDG